MKNQPLVVLTDPIHREIIKTELKPHARVRIVTNRKDLETAVRSADAIITQLGDRVDESLLRSAKKLRVVGNYAVGVNNIDLKACKRLGVSVVNTPNVLTRATAELALALLLAAAKRVPEGEKMCRANAFPGWKPDLLLGQLLHGRRAVLVGRGRIGRETGRLFRAIGIHVDWITREDSESAIRQKMASAQILSLHTPLTRDTHHWLNSRRISYLPSDAIVLNTTRGPVVDEKALIQALKKRRIFAAGLDVFENEPEVPAALRKLPNVVLLPHLGSATRETREAMARLVVEGVLGILGGKRPWNAVVLSGHAIPGKRR